jgi:hypothetical protein
MLTKNKSTLGGKKSSSSSFGLMLMLVVVVAGAIFFGSWIRHLNEQMASELFQKTSDTPVVKTEGGEALSKKQTTDSGIVYADEERGFRLVLPKDGRRYAVKEIEPKGEDRAVLFGLPLTDSEVKKVKKEDYSEIFRIELVPLKSLGKKTCADKSSQFPFCDLDDQELGRNEQFVFIYTRYDRLDEVEKSKIRLIPADFDAKIFAQADAIVKSFRIVNAQLGLMDKKL